MTDDIVARLRVLNHHAKKLAENESLHDLHRDAFTRCENLTWEAADEIEGLRRDYSAAEQDHVYAVVAYSEAKQEIERLRAELRSYTGDKHSTREPFEASEPFTPEAL